MAPCVCESIDADAVEEDEPPGGLCMVGDAVMGSLCVCVVVSRAKVSNGN